MIPIQHVCDIIKREMTLQNGQVFLYNNKVDLPPDQEVYISVGILTCKPFSSRSQFVDNDSGLLESQSVNMHATLSIEIQGRGTQARDRKEEIILALQSTYSQQIQEAYGFFIAPVTSSFVNLSEIDGEAIPYRFNISVAIQYKVVKEKQIDYYNVYPTPTVTPEA